MENPKVPDKISNDILHKAKGQRKGKQVSMQFHLANYFNSYTDLYSLTNYEVLIVSRELKALAELRASWGEPYNSYDPIGMLASDLLIKISEKFDNQLKHKVYNGRGVDLWCTTRKATQILGVRGDTLRRWVKEGEDINFIKDVHWKYNILRRAYLWNPINIAFRKIP
tara:strand:+ start:118 stop:621 length:504 start_codon:yes stop_codon:yes gene_type:complete